MPTHSFAKKCIWLPKYVARAFCERKNLNIVFLRSETLKNGATDKIREKQEGNLIKENSEELR